MSESAYRMSVFFFFSSRRRHTRFDCDWSSDVCSSDLDGGVTETKVEIKKMLEAKIPDMPLQADDILFVPVSGGKIFAARTFRSEERRVGKECRSRWSRCGYKKNLEVESEETRTRRTDI